MKKQQGIALIAAIFLVVVIGAALALLATLSLRGSQQTTQNLLQARAQAAAQSAIEYGAQLLVNGTSCTGAELNTTMTLPAFANYIATLNCTQNIYNRPSQTISLFKLQVTVEYGTPNTADYVWTQTEATLEL